MSKWLALALAFNSHTCSSLPYWKSEFEGLFIFTPQRCVHVQERGMIHRWQHGATDINRILMWCAWDCTEVVKEIKAVKRVQTGPPWKSTETGTIPHQPPTPTDSGLLCLWTVKIHKHIPSRFKLSGCVISWREADQTNTASSLKV